MLGMCKKLLDSWLYKSILACSGMVLFDYMLHNLL